jgi:hypothetical protein
MTKMPDARVDDLVFNHRVEQAGLLANEIVEACGIGTPPVNPYQIAETEKRRLTLIGDDFGDEFDGQLEYHRDHDRFLLFFNTKYDSGEPAGEHHPRTRFSIAHELGHFYIDEHRLFLTRGGSGHISKSEFLSSLPVEREADNFAANLLMPKRLLMPEVNKSQLNLTRLRWLADRFQTSLLSTAIRCVKLSPFPCSLIALSQGAIAWRFTSQGFIDGRCYPLSKNQLDPRAALEQWKRHERGEIILRSEDVPADQWFQIYGKLAESGLWVHQEYLPVSVANLFLVLVTADERDIIPDLDE